MTGKKQSLIEIISVISVIFIIIGSIAAVLVVPEFRQWFGLDSTKPTEPPFPTIQPLPQITPSPTLPVQIQPTVVSTVQLPVYSIGHGQITDFGSSQLILSNNQVAIGTADRFQDVLDLYIPPITIFVIYGLINVELSIYWGGWDLWENASENFIESQISLKIDEIKASHPNDYDTRGYRVIKCYSQVTNCETILTFP